MPKLSDRFQILVDFDPKEKLYSSICEFLDCRAEVFDYLQADAKVALIDVVLHRTERKTRKPILLIMSLPNLERLLFEKSPWNNDALKLIKQGHIRIVVHCHLQGESIHLLHNTICMINENRNLSQEQLTARGMISKETVEIIKEIPLTYLSNGGLAGQVIKSNFPLWKFITIEQQVVDVEEYHHVYHISKKRKRWAHHTFFMTTRLQSIFRDHRKWILDQIEKRPLVKKDAILKISKNWETRKTDGREYLSDYEDQYGKKWLDSEVGIPYIPNPYFYLNSNFEMVCETLGHIRSDDSFFVTEKTFKPMIMAHPFIVMAPRHHLRNLKALGFETFSTIIDESYDDSDDGMDRAGKIGELLESLDLRHSKNFYEASREICRHNQDHLMNLHGRYKFDQWGRLEDFFSNYQ